MFADRRESGKMLAERLGSYASSGAIVFALPRGGVIVGCEIARRLELPIEIVSVRKIGHPELPEYAIGAVSENGRTIVDEHEAPVDKRWLADEIEREIGEAVRRRYAYAGSHKEISAKGETCIVVDDGAATGLTMSIAIEEVKARGAKRVVVAVPIISTEAARRIAGACDETVVIEGPGDFSESVGGYYKLFEQLSDEEVASALSAMWSERSGSRRSRLGHKVIRRGQVRHHR